MYLSGSQNIQKSMNGLLKIRATEIDCDIATINEIDGIQTINGKIGENVVVTTDGGNFQFNSDVSMNNNLNVSGTSYLNTLNVSGKSQFGNDASLNGIFETDGKIIIRDPLNLTNYIQMYHDISQFGFVFQLENINQIMYFKVKDGSTPGVYKQLYFATSQIYSNIKFYQDEVFNQSYNLKFYQGDSNGGGQGGYFYYVPSTNAWDGWQFVNQGIPGSGLILYTNFACSNGAGTQTQTLRMNFNNIWSLVPHTFNSTFTASSSSTFTGLSTFNGGIVCNANMHSSTIDVSGNAIFNGPVACNSTFNAQTGSFSSNLGVIGDFTCGKINGNGNLTLTGLLNTISGATTFSGATTINNTLTTNNNITQTGTTATTNRIIQSRILNDITGNPNQFKYSEFLYNNSGAGTPQPAIVAKEETSTNSMYFFPKLNAGNYNSIVQANDRGIFAFYPIDNNAVTLTCWANTKVGVRCASTSSTATFVDIWAGNYNLKLDSSSGIVASANNWISNNPDFAVLNNIKSRGIRFISQADTGGSNPFVVQTDAVISTQSQNSSLVLTSANSALNFGIRISSSSTTVGSIVSRVASNSITTNQTNTTIAGPVTLTNNLTFSDATVQTTAFNSTALGYTRVGSTFTYPSNTIINCAVGGIGNEIKCHKFNCYNIIEYPDGSIQNTAYTNAKDTKLTAIGTTYTGTLTTATLTTGAFYNCGSISLNAGTYILTINATFLVITGSTTIGQILTSHSTSSTGLSANANLNIDNKNGATYAVGVQFILPTTAIVSPTTTTTYYCLVQASFGTASRLQFNSTNSRFSAVKIA